MKRNQSSEVERRLLLVVEELEKQTTVAANYRKDRLPFADEMLQIREYLQVAGEYGIAYETIVAAIEAHPFTLSGKSCVALLEVALFFGYKTDPEEVPAIPKN